MGRGGHGGRDLGEFDAFLGSLKSRDSITTTQIRLALSLTTMTDNSINPSTDKLASQADPSAGVHTPSPVATPPVVAPDVIDAGVIPPDPTGRITASNVTPPVQETPQRDTVIDPRVVALRAMFPDYDDLILCVRSSR